ncbi:toll/interleukin-1 receptor domain-containing protein [Gemmatimonas sp.]|uniref:toll/interleukin-1 receptor domain-containing protein n=1 Tax=Gemmatimonas sp. TaxID=1962908 RepID=UPI0025C1AEA5|nr:toll/interleukin-1 receptor domain-containing protein [Gemmatimonas sp.]MCA2992771.1 toll/interleukin-1 receptor domain-containing protein [Gemmatimonas sp.]MCA3382566.1 toll/interleukin-1 receptor domain-containing protein [Roseomonas sp.]
MAFVESHAYDVFVSYAHADERIDPSGERWVSRFIEVLQGALRARLGMSEEVHWFFDSEALHANHQVEEVLKAARNSAVFLAVASRSYAAREWTRRELQAFSTAAAGDTRRLFAIECLPLDNSESYPEPLNGHKRLSFWRALGADGSTPIPLTPEFDAPIFRQRVLDLAEQIRGQLLAMRQTLTAATKAAAAASMPRPIGVRQVMLAQVTDDLDDLRDDLRRYLEQYGVPLVPVDGYPLGGDAFRGAVARDVETSEVFVQLLGTRAGKTPPDLPEGYTVHQYNTARAKGLEILQWRRPDLDLASIADVHHRQLLSGESVIADGFEAFKAEVKRRALRPPEMPRRQPTPGALVFINADRDDFPLAEQIYDEFKRNRIAVSLPDPDAEGEQARNDIESNLVDCDALITIYGYAPSSWVTGNLRRFLKLAGRRQTDPRLVALYAGPPGEKRLPLPIHVPDMIEIDCRNGVSLDPIRNIVVTLMKAQ